ncbi:MAG: hypothetical protein M3384_14520 [Acidobacteriota bacterium]|nr:hypothetical protein [Acidobacteriota bacterium]
MKTCPNCKKQYADNVAVCPADGTFLDLDTPASGTRATDLTEDAVTPHVAESVDRVGTAAAETFDRDATGDFGAGHMETVGDIAAPSATATTAFSRNVDSTDDDSGGDYAENPMLGWLVPLIIVIILVILGYMFCSKPGTPTAKTSEIRTSADANRLI